VLGPSPTLGLVIGFEELHRLGEVEDRLRGVGPLEVKTGPIEQCAAQLGTVAQEINGSVVVGEGSAGVADVLVHQAER